MYHIVVENDFRDIIGRIEYRWYSALATRFEAVQTKSICPNNYGSIRIYLNDKLIGSFKKKSDAVGCIRKLINDAPLACRSDFEAHGNYLFDAIDN